MPFEKVYVAIDLEPKKILTQNSPLHITITPPAALEDSVIAELIDRLSNGLANIGLIEVEGQDEAEFGSSNSSVRVRKIAMNVTLSKLHEIAMDIMEEFSPNIDKAYARKNWQPHSTYRDEIGLSEGDKQTVDHVILLGKKSGSWYRIAKIPLIDRYETKT